MSDPKSTPQGILPTMLKINEYMNEVYDVLNNILAKEMTEEHADVVRNKIEKIKAKLEEIPDTLMEGYNLIQSVIKSIHSSRCELKKSVDGLIKKTGVQLQKVTSTTEEATNKILDVAEKLDDDQMKIIDLVEKIEAAIKNESGENTSQQFSELKEKIYANQDSAFTIMDYLQFQDITAQQIAGAYALLADTEGTLIYVSDMLKNFDSDSESGKFTKKAIDDKSFNADASFNDKGNIQDAIDNLFDTGNADADIPEDVQNSTGGTQTLDSIEHHGDYNSVIDDDEINKLFDTSPSDDKMGNDEINNLFDSDSEKKEKEEKDSASQDEIDKLFS
eukprot:Anaeramoba_ignava/a478447_17.p1 GENE.a478447_17~~a478447_17.p1  ORF type:complete len:333 (+),score=56.48 a478447_17:874-1872(+)